MVCALVPEVAAQGGAPEMGNFHWRHLLHTASSQELRDGRFSSQIYIQKEAFLENRHREAEGGRAKQRAAKGACRERAEGDGVAPAARAVRGYETAAGVEEAAQDEKSQEERARGMQKETEWLQQQEEKLHTWEGCLHAEQERDCSVDNEFARA